MENVYMQKWRVWTHLKLRCDERFTHVFTARGCVFNKIRWLDQTKVITLKNQLHAVNKRWKRLLQLSFKEMFLKLCCDERFTNAFTARGCVFNKIRWLDQTKVITWKTQLHAVNEHWKRLSQLSLKEMLLKLCCDERFTHAFFACGSVFKEITLVGSNQGNYFENATACSKRMRKTTVATQP